MPQSTHTHDEEWRPIPGYEGRYEVSDQGRVYSCARSFVDVLGRPRMHKGRFLRPTVNQWGYQVFTLYKDSMHEREYVHRAVLKAFVGDMSDTHITRHLNGNPRDNRLENLKWGTQKENIHDEIIHGTHVETRKTHCPRGHLLQEPNLVFWYLKRGKRICRSCHNARSYLKRRKELMPKIWEFADAYYKNQYDPNLFKEQA